MWVYFEGRDYTIPSGFYVGGKRNAQATKHCYLVGEAVGKGAFAGISQKFSSEHAEFETLDIQVEMWNKQLDVLTWSSGLQR